MSFLLRPGPAVSSFFCLLGSLCTSSGALCWRIGSQVAWSDVKDSQNLLVCLELFTLNVVPIQFAIPDCSDRR